MRIKVVRCRASNSELAGVLARSMLRDRIVIGNDWASTKALGFCIEARSRQYCRCTTKTLAELIWPLLDADLVLGRWEYKELLCHQRKETVRDMRRAKLGLFTLPKTQSLIGQRNVHSDYLTPSTRTLDALGTRLEELGACSLDWAIARAQARGPVPVPLLPHPAAPALFVFVVSRGMSPQEMDLLVWYMDLATLTDHDREVWVVVEDEGAWSDVVKKLPSDCPIEETTIPEAKDVDDASGYRGVKLGHVAWEPASLKTQIGNIRNLVRQAIRDKIDLSEVAVLADSPALACYVRTALVEMGVPVQCSESELLPMRPSVHDMMALLSAFVGTCRLPGVSRIMRFLPKIGSERLYDLVELLDRGASDVEVQGFASGLHEHQAKDVLGWMLPLRCVDSLKPEDAVDRAAQCFRSFAYARELTDLEQYLWALRRWAGGFNSVEAMLSAFWRWRAMFAEWSGYRPGSGLAVEGECGRGLTVGLYRAEGQAPDMSGAVHCYLAPVIEQDHKPKSLNSVQNCGGISQSQIMATHA